MARKTQALETAKTRKVRVHEQRTYVDEEPVEDVSLEGLEGLEALPADPIADFLAGLDMDRQLTLHVFVHPNFSRDGKVGTRSERMFVTSFAFTADEPETYRQRIQYCYLQGGMFTCELRERGVVVKKWEEQLSPVPGHEAPKSNGYPFPPPPAISIRMPETQQAHVEPVNPIQVVRDQFGMMREMVSVMKELTPAPPVVNVGEQQRSAEERPLQERLLEAVALKALESKDTPIDRVLDALSGRRDKEPSWVDSFMPVIAELAKGLIPTISMMGQQYMRTLAQQAGQNGAVQVSPTGVEAEQPPAQLTPPMDPAERAWRRVVQRMLEDCFEHVAIVQAISAVGSVSPGDGMSTRLHADSIIDLLDRFQSNEQLVAMVQMLLNAEPPDVVDMCALLQGSERDATMVQGLKEVPVALLWLKELQEETKKILAEGNEGEE